MLLRGAGLPQEQVGGSLGQRRAAQGRRRTLMLSYTGALLRVCGFTRPGQLEAGLVLTGGRLQGCVRSGSGGWGGCSPFTSAQ